MRFISFRVLLLFLLSSWLVLNVSAAPQYRDGRYFGMSRRTEVEGLFKISVLIQRGRIQEIDILDLPARLKKSSLTQGLIKRALKLQSPEMKFSSKTRIEVQMFQEALGDALSRAGGWLEPPGLVQEDEVRLEVDTSEGKLILALYPMVGPVVSKLLALVEEGYYNNNIIYREIPRTLVYLGQEKTSPPDGWPPPQGNSLPGMSFDRLGMIGATGEEGIMFINAVRAPWLDGQYPLIGRVVGGFRIIAELSLDESPPVLKVFQVRLLEKENN